MLMDYTLLEEKEIYKIASVVLRAIGTIRQWVK
jgi:hypothetical protein